MFLFKTDFSIRLISLLIISIIIGTCLVSLGGYLTDNYFSRMVSGIIGSYGEYDLLLTISSEKTDIALNQIRKVLDNKLAGSSLKEGPVLAGSSNYLVKIPDEKKSYEIYSGMHGYFGGIPGLMSTTIITEPRISLRSFRGDSVLELWDKINNIEGIDFSYRISDGLDIVVKKPELVPEVKSEVKKILNRYRLFEIRYPLGRKNTNPDEIKNKLLSYFSEKKIISSVTDVTDSSLTENMALLKNLQQMKGFLLSYAARVEFQLEEPDSLPAGTELTIPVESENKVNPVLKVVKNEGAKVIAVLKKGKLDNITEASVYLYQAGTRGRYVAEAKVKNPRAELATTLEQLNKIEPALNSFLEQSGQLAEYSSDLSNDLGDIEKGLASLKNVSNKLNDNLENWKRENLSHFLEELLQVLAKIKSNTGDVGEIQGELIKTSNRLKETAGMIEEKLVFLPRNNKLYSELEEVKNLFLQLSDLMDENYDIAAERMSEIDPVIASIDQWEKKIKSLLAIEENILKEMDWKELESVIDEIDKTASYFDTADLEKELKEMRELLTQVKTGHLPAIVEQLEYIKNSLPQLKEKEIIDTLELIDKYLAGRVIPGDRIQLLIKGNYDEKQVISEVKEVINDPGVSYYDLEAGVVSVNPRSEIFNVLRQVRAVISTIIALIFTLLVMFFDQSLLISVIKLNGGRGYIYSFLVGSLIFSTIYYLSSISFPYLGLLSNILIGGIIGIITAFLAEMLNPVDGEEWEAGKAMGFSFAEIMSEIIIPAGKPGLLYLFNYRKIIFK